MKPSSVQGGGGEFMQRLPHVDKFWWGDGGLMYLLAE